MCIVSAENVGVFISKTMILLAWLGSEFQLTVYQNKVGFFDISKNSSMAMVLPVPRMAGGAEITILDLSTYNDIFSNLASGFPLIPVSADLSYSYPPTHLPINRIGSYDVTVVDTMSDFKRVDKKHFVLAPDTESVLAENYPEGFSFIVAKLDVHSTKGNHALGYIHRNTSTSLFVPTRHAGHLEEKFGTDNIWDHQIYVYGNHVSDFIAGFHVAPIIHRLSCFQFANLDTLTLNDIIWQAQVKKAEHEGNKTMPDELRIRHWFWSPLTRFRVNFDPSYNGDLWLAPDNSRYC